MGEPRSEASRFEDFVGYIGALAKEIQRIKATESAHLGLQGADIMALYYLGHSESGMTGAELARAAGVTRAAISRTLARMEREGFVVVSGSSDTSSRYKAPVVLTEQGRSAAVAADQRIHYVMEQVVQAQSDEERAQMYDSLERVLACLKGLSRD